MRACAALVVGSMALFSQARADSLSMREAGSHDTEATITVDATPAQVYALVTGYDRWPVTLSDVRSVKVERGDRDHARVRFHSQILDHDVTVEFDNERDHLIRFEGVEGPPGGRARGTYVLEPVDGGRRTRVVATLHLELVGMPRLFVSEGKIRSLRQAKLRADLLDVARQLEHH